MMDDFLRQCADNRVFRAFYTLPPLKNNDDSYVQDEFYYNETSYFSGGNNETILFTINTIFGGQKSIHDIFVCMCCCCNIYSSLCCVELT